METRCERLLARVTPGAPQICGTGPTRSSAGPSSSRQELSSSSARYARHERPSAIPPGPSGDGRVGEEPQSGCREPDHEAGLLAVGVPRRHQHPTGSQGERGGDPFGDPPSATLRVQCPATQTSGQRPPCGRNTREVREERSEVRVGQRRQRRLLTTLELLERQPSTYVVLSQRVHAFITLGITNTNCSVLIEVSRRCAHIGMLAQPNRSVGQPDPTRSFVSARRLEDRFAADPCGSGGGGV